MYFCEPLFSKGIGFNPVTAHDLLQRLAFKSAELGGPGDIALAGGKNIIDITGVKRLQGLFLGRFIGELLKGAVYQADRLSLFIEAHIPGSDIISGRKQNALYDEIFHFPDISFPDSAYKDFQKLGGYPFVRFI